MSVPKLTRLQTQIISMVAEGLHNAEIGKNVGLTEDTIKYRLHVIFDLTGMSTRTELAVWWLHHQSQFAKGDAA